MSNNRKKIAIFPRLNDCGGDMTKQWFVFYSYLHPGTGKMVRFRHSDGFGRHPDPETRYTKGNALAAELRAKIKDGWNPFEDDSDVLWEDMLQYKHITDKIGNIRKSSRTCEYYLNSFYQERKKDLKPASYATYKSKLRIWCQYLINSGMKDIDVRDITPDHVKKFLNELKDKRELSNISIKKYHQILHNYFEWLIQGKHVTSNPCRNIRIKASECTPAKYFSDAQIEKMKAVILKNDPQLWLAILFQYYCFIRPGELRQLKVADLDLQQGSVTIRNEISKNKRTQVVRIPDPFLKILSEKRVMDSSPSDFVITISGKPGPNIVGKNYLRSHFNRIRTILGLPRDHKFYSWKHTGALKAAGTIPINDLKLQLRHKDLSTTDRYLRQMKVTDSEALKSLFPEI